MGGLEFPDEEGLEGHSDADVIIHAIADALLGAAALGDIGRRFPDNDLKGTTYYAIMRSIQIRPLRLPKPQVKIGTQLPDDYR